MESNRPLSKSVKSLFGFSMPVRHALNVAVCAILYPMTLYANPEGAQIIHGQVSIETPGKGVTNITNSPNAIIHWENFNIAQNEITRFIQENGQSAVLNRIMGGDPSQILGQLVSNGKVFLINPNGIVFGQNARIDTQGLIASSLNLSDEDFLKGNYHFMAGAKAGDIVNEGLIRAGKDGNIVLIAPSIKNNGIIKSEGGQITLAAGQALVLTNLDDPEIRFEIQAPSNAVLNLGKLLTEGGAVNVFAGSIKHQGEINADSVEVDAQGQIKLVAQNDINLTAGSKISVNGRQGDAGTILVESKTGKVSVQGNIEANAGQTGKGGDIKILGEQVGLLDSASVAANGGQGGGEILIGGDQQGKNQAVHNAKATFVGSKTRISANATSLGNGGKVIVWADQATRAYGNISVKGGKQGGDGGFVETSANVLDVSGIKVDASAPKGRGGKWLLDPNNITIQAAGSNAYVKGEPDWTTENDNAVVTTGSIQAALNNGTSVTVSTGTSGTNSQAGNITVASGIVKSSGDNASLTLQAHNNIDINAPIVSQSGKLDLLLSPNSDGNGGGITSINKLVDLNAGTLTLNRESHIASSSVIRNASILIPSSANSKVDGLITDVAAINIEKSAKLAINRANASLNAILTNHGTLDVNAFFILNTLNINSGILTGSGNVTVTNSLNINAGTVLNGDGILITKPSTTTALTGTGDIVVDKQWNNSGVVDWSGPVNIVGGEIDAPLNNFAEGIINISGVGTRQLSTSVFNNKGTLNLSGGTLQLLSSGNDTGSYNVTGGGFLQFLSAGTRNFYGVQINSANKVSFGNGINNFFKGSVYNAPETQVSQFASLNFNTGNAISLAKLNIDNAMLGGIDALTITDNLTLQAATLGGVGKLTTSASSLTTLAGDATIYLNKRWDNYGTINWQNAPLADNGKIATLTNALGGIMNIGSTATAVDKEFAINTARFNNQGTVNLLGGTLKVISPGTDTGHYQVAGNGQLQFQYGLRVFDQAEINSPNTVTFSYGKNYFRNGASYYAAQTDLLYEAVLNFSNKGAINFPKLTIDGGTLEGSDSVSITEQFDFHSGTVRGGALTTAAGSITTLADKDTVYLGKNWDNLGTVSWNGIGNLRNPSNLNAAFNNQASGVFNVSAEKPDIPLQIDLARFNNNGKLNLISGLLKISSSGNDSGAYKASENAELQFWAETRNFNDGASISSVNKVTFAGGGNHTFNTGAAYSVGGMVIDNAKVSFNTGNTIKLPSLTMSNNSFLKSTDPIEIAKALNMSNSFFTGNGSLMTSADAVTSLDEGNALLDKNWDNYGTVNLTSDGTMPTIPTDIRLPIRRWNNHGTIFWQSQVLPANELVKNIIFTNKADGVYNINNPSNASAARIVKLGAFNNEGTVNLLNGAFKILAPGVDTGTYHVTGTGQLQFQDASRVFNGSTIDSPNSVRFIGGTIFVNDGALINAPKTNIEGATFNVNTPLALENVLMSDGVINNKAGFTTNGQFDWSGGELAGAGAYRFTNGFNYSAGTVTATGSIEIKDDSDELTLPSMPSISKLYASSSGHLVLAGDMLASGKGTAIQLQAETLSVNNPDIVLSTPNGRWLIYTDTPTENNLGNMVSSFKHYGCQASAACNDGFDVTSASGNGLLYKIIPVLSVTPNNISSVYGEDAAFTTSYSGFIDGDDASSAGIAGSASFSVGGETSGAGYHRAGAHELAYESGLTNQLGYQFKDNAGSVLEWTVTPRSLAVQADALAKIYADADPSFTYQAAGLLAGDTLSGGLSREQGENVGGYGINQGSLQASSDYQLAYSSANLTVSPRALSVVADPQAKLLGELDPVLTYTSSGLVNADTLTGGLGRIIGEAVGRYAITQGTLKASPNYRLTYTGADLTIKAPSVSEVIVRRETDQQQNRALVLIQQSAFDEQLESMITNNTPKANNTAQVDGNTKKGSRNAIKQCQ